MAESELVAVEWVVPTSTSIATREDLKRFGAQLQSADHPFVPPAGQEDDYSEAAFEPLTVIAGVMGLLYVARRVIKLVKDLHHDGLIIDARTEPVQIRPHPSLDRGQLLVITAGGSQFFESSGEANDLTALLAGIHGG